MLDILPSRACEKKLCAIEKLLGHIYRVRSLEIQKKELTFFLLEAQQASIYTCFDSFLLNMFTHLFWCIILARCLFPQL